ncbi:MAG: tetratricopeptide repeat protein [Rubrivivax sp.]|nr:tetratricopeptide repeat protein [Rubrivivax sp.]
MPPGPPPCRPPPSPRRLLHARGRARPAEHAGAAAAATPQRSPSATATVVAEAGAGAHPQTYTLAEVSSLLGLPRPVVTGLVAAGFVTPARGPRREYRFSFQDLVLLRAAQGLKEARMPPGRIQRSLKALRATLPAQMPAGGLRLGAVGNDIVVREKGAGAWQNAAGQWLLDFEGGGPATGGAAAATQAAPGASTRVQSLRGGAAPVKLAAPATGHAPPAWPPAPPVAPTGRPRPSPAAQGKVGAEQWFQRAVDLEPADPARAEAAYRHAIAADPRRTDAYLNLGALLGDAGRPADAVAVARLGIARCAPEPLLHFNLAVALEDAGQAADAMTAYEHALAMDAALADAHFNLARLHDRLGDKKRAIRHYSAYRRLRGKA